jgi:MerR family mercuric resistance operon transcriptional regulator
MEKAMTIKKVAELAGIGVETVRFYEREELIPEPPRTESGYRQYTPEAVSRLKFIKRAQALGFTLPEIKELLALKVARSTKREDIRKKARKKIADIEAKIQTLQSIKQALEHITEACHGKGPLSGCPILKAFEEGDCCHK